MTEREKRGRERASLEREVEESKNKLRKMTRKQKREKAEMSKKKRTMTSKEKAAKKKAEKQKIDKMVNFINGKEQESESGSDESSYESDGGNSINSMDSVEWERVNGNLHEFRNPVEETEKVEKKAKRSKKLWKKTLKKKHSLIKGLAWGAGTAAATPLKIQLNQLELKAKAKKTKAKNSKAKKTEGEIKQLKLVRQETGMIIDGDFLEFPLEFEVPTTQAEQRDLDEKVARAKEGGKEGGKEGSEVPDNWDDENFDDLDGLFSNLSVNGKGDCKKTEHESDSDSDDEIDLTSIVKKDPPAKSIMKKTGWQGHGLGKREQGIASFDNLKFKNQPKKQPTRGLGFKGRGKKRQRTGKAKKKTEKTEKIETDPAKLEELQNILSASNDFVKKAREQQKQEKKTEKKDDEFDAIVSAVMRGDVETVRGRSSGLTNPNPKKKKRGRKGYKDMTALFARTVNQQMQQKQEEREDNAKKVKEAKQMRNEQRTRVFSIMAARNSTDSGTKRLANASLRNTKRCKGAFDYTKGEWKEVNQCTHNNCTFAHDQENLETALLSNTCIFDGGYGGCRKKNNCPRIHTVPVDQSNPDGPRRNETADEFKERMGFGIADWRDPASKGKIQVPRRQAKTITRSAFRKEGMSFSDIMASHKLVPSAVVLSTSNFPALGSNGNEKATEKATEKEIEQPNLNGKEPESKSNSNTGSIADILVEFRLPPNIEDALNEFGVDCLGDLQDFEEDDLQDFEEELKKLDGRKFKQKQNIKRFKLMINHLNSH